MIVTHLIVSMNSPVSFSNIISMEDIKAESMDGAKERERVDICSYIDHVQGREGCASSPPGPWSLDKWVLACDLPIGLILYCVDLKVFDLLQ